MGGGTNEKGCVRKVIQLKTIKHEDGDESVKTGSKSEGTAGVWRSMRDGLTVVLCVGGATGGLELGVGLHQGPATLMDRLMRSGRSL